MKHCFLCGNYFLVVIQDSQRGMFVTASRHFYYCKRESKNCFRTGHETPVAGIEN